MAADTPPISVLCVDDDPGSADLTATLLERSDGDLSVDTAAGAREGLERLGGGERDVACVVSAYDMPGMDGLAFLEAVRADYPDLPFILFPDNGSEEVASDAISAGVTDYMRKAGGTDQYDALARRVVNAVARARDREVASEARQRAKTILDASPDAIVVSVDGGTVYANPAAVDLFDAEGAAALTRSPVRELVGADGTDDAAAPVRAVQAREREVTRARRTIQTREGETLPVEVTARHITWDGDDGVVAILRDLSAREAARREQARYRAAFEDAFDAMAFVDDEGRFLDANRSACDLFGVPEADLLGRTLRDFLPEEVDVEAAWGQFTAPESGRERERGRVPLRRASGERRTVEYTATGDIVPGEHLAVLRDVTPKAERERELERQNERLEEFASVIAHDLRNPLTTVRGYVELAREEPDPGHFDRIEHGLDRMERIIDDLLWLAREGRQIGTTSPVDLADAVRDAWKTVAGASADADLVVAADPGAVTADDDRLRQLLENLLANALDHGGPGVTVTVGPLAEGFYVADDGPGIPESIRDRVFEPGYSTDDDGTGYGLVIAAQIADAHGWDIAVAESEAGGARIEVRTGGDAEA